MPFGCLLGDFLRHFRSLWGFAGWHSPSSENLYFQVLFQVWNQGVFFIGFSMIFYDLGAIWGSLLVPFGLPFRVVFMLCSGFASGLVLGAFWNAFWSLLEAFLKPVGSLGATFGRLLANFGSLGGGF